MVSFRPLIRGFFFYVTLSVTLTDRKAAVSVPSFGDSFFIAVNNFTITSEDGHCFRPLIRGFFFYLPYAENSKAEAHVVSVPSFGDSFFIKGSEFVITALDGAVSVPSFGDSFFMAAVILEESAEEKESFRPLIRGFFFY